MKVAFRTDASRAIGAGHLVRCLTLANGLARNGAAVVFVTRELPKPLRPLLDGKPFDVVVLDGLRPEPESRTGLEHPWPEDVQLADASATREVLSTGSWEWLVVDHYGLDERWERAVSGAAEQVLVIDDLADRPHECDLLLDYNFYEGMEERYRDMTPQRCGLLLGPRYAPLRPEFGEWRSRVRARNGPVARVLVFFGGIDAANNTLCALAALERTRTSATVDVVVGAAHSDRLAIESRCDALGFRCHVQPAHMGELMARADLAIGAGGVTVLERCCVGLPALSFVVASNQRRQVMDAAAAGLLYAPDRTEGISSAVIERHCRALVENTPLRHLISTRGMEAVDGRGTSRVLRRLGCFEVTVREARMEDSGRLFEWRNHPSVRAVSRTRDPISRESHERWMSSVLGDVDRVLLIGERRGTPVGAVRFDVREAEAEVSIHLAPENAGSGLGGQLLDAAERWLASARPDVTQCTANVLDDNARSRHLFVSSGYRAKSTWYSKRLAAV